MEEEKGFPWPCTLEQPPPTIKDKLKSLLWKVYGILFYIFLAMLAYAVLRNFVHGASVVD